MPKRDKAPFMSDQFFNFSFEHWPIVLLGLIAVFINTSIFIYALFFIRRASLSTAFLLFLFTLIMWGILEVILRISVSKESAEIWHRILFMPANFIGACGLHFILIFINNDGQKLKNYHLLVLYLPPLVFSMLFASGLEQLVFKHTESWGWVFVPSHFFGIISYMLVGIHALLMLLLLSRHTWQLRKSKSIQFKRAGIILVGLSVPVISGCVLQVFIPVLFHYNPIPVASASTVFLSFAILIAITKYNLLEFSPMHQWENIVENMNEGILIVDNNNIIQYVNNKFCEMLVYSRSELLNKCAGDMFSLPAEKTTINKMTERQKQLFRNKYELVMRRKDNSEIICEINAQPYLDENKKVIGSVKIHTDVTEQRKTAKRIKESESRYRSFVEQANDGIFITDRSGNISEANLKACQMLGYTREEILKINATSLLFENDLRDNPPKISEITWDKSFLSVRTFKRKDGSAIPVEINSKIMSDGYILGIIRDITERKKSEETLLEKVNEMDVFIHRVSHDLRGPLASIAGLTYLGKEEVKNTHADIYFDKIAYSTLRLDNILRELSKFARVTQTKIKPVVIDLNKEVDDILESIKHLPDLSSIEIVKEISIPYLICDKTLLIIIIQNLIVNSINYHDKKKEKSFVRIKAHENSGGVEIIVSDNVIGKHYTINTGHN